MSKDNSLIDFRESLLKVSELTRTPVQFISRPVYLVTCNQYKIKGWSKDHIAEYKNGWTHLKKEAMRAEKEDRIVIPEFSLEECNKSIDEYDMMELKPDISPLRANILEDYGKFIRSFHYVPTMKYFQKWIDDIVDRRIYANIFDIDRDYRKYYPEKAKANLLDKMSWTPEYRKEFFDEIKKHSTFIFVSIGSFCTVDFHFLSALKTYAEVNNAMIIGLPLFKKYDKAVYDFCVPPEVGKYMWIAFEDIVLNDNLMVQVIKANCTTKSTLTGLNQIVAKYDSSIIVAGINQQMKYIPVLKNKTPNMIASTGCCTEYDPVKKDELIKIPTKAEKLAQERLTIKGGLVVELGINDTFSVRNIEAEENGAFIDLSVQYSPNGAVMDITGSTFVIGDLHAPKQNNELLDANIKLLEELHCDTVVLHDSVNMAYISHHNADKAITKAQMAENGEADVLDEIKVFTQILDKLDNVEGLHKIIIPYSNHPAHFERFIQDIGRMSKDSINLRTSLLVALAMLDNRIVLQYLTEDLAGYHSDKLEWLREDEGKEIYGVQVGLHGSEKVNGGKMTSTSTNNAFPKTVIAHKHSAGIDGDTITVGIACEKEQGYNHGLSSWTESSAIIYPNGKVQLLTFVDISVEGENRLWP